MSKTQRKPILNASLPLRFRQIRIVLAREPGHPQGDDEVVYIFDAPVDADGRIDAETMARRIARHAELCGNVRTSKQERSPRAQPGGSWRFHYEGEANLPDERVIISPTNASSSASMSLSTNAARCIPTA